MSLVESMYFMRLGVWAMALPFAAALLLLSSCTDMGSGLPGMKGKPSWSGNQKFYSAAEPGKWVPFAADHEPECLVAEEKGTRRIEVSVRFTRRRDPAHYVEAILLLNANRKELAKKSFKRGERAEAMLEIPGDAKYPLYVVSKCNRHGMWEKKIEGREGVARE